MKVAARVLDVDSTLEGEKIGMTIDNNALAHIMSVLTDLYSDPEMAVIREYSTNAFDAHVEAGVTRPIEVQTPSALSPYFKVRDYGAGLDADDIRDIYSRYGASTKRDSNDVVGMLGLGCKSALTYTDQFTLSGIKNGIRTEVAISRDEDGAGSMTIISQYETDEPSGVEVVVPVKARSLFAEKCAHFFKFWTVGTVQVDGKEPTPIEGMWLTDKILVTRTGISQDYVVMGNVAYPMSGQVDQSVNRYYDNPYDNRFYTVAYVNIGDVNFTPSREALQMNALTKATIKDIQETVKVKQQEAFQREIDDAATKQDALLKYYEVKSMGYNPQGEPTYKGKEIPLRYNFKVETKAKDEVKNDKGVVIIPAVKAEKGEQMPIYVDGRRYRGSKGWNRYSELSAEKLIKRNDHYRAYEPAIFFIGYDGADFTPTKRKKLEVWADTNSVKLPDHVILLDKIPSVFKGWYDESRVYDWAQVAAVKLVYARTVREDGRPSGSYEGWVDGKRMTIQAEDIDTSKPLYFINTTVEGSGGLAIVAEAHNDKYTVVSMPNNRVVKFQRDFPNAKRLWPAAVELAKAWEKSLTEDQLLALAFANLGYYEDANLVKKLDASRIDDPELAGIVKAATTKPSDKLKKQYTAYSVALDMKLEAVKDPFKDYPLLTVMNSYGTINSTVKEEMYLYFNAAYAARKDGK